MHSTGVYKNLGNKEEEMEVKQEGKKQVMKWASYEQLEEITVGPHLTITWSETVQTYNSAG